MVMTAQTQNTIACQTYWVRRGLSVLWFRFCTMTGLGQRYYVMRLARGRVFARNGSEQFRPYFDALMALPAGAWAEINQNELDPAGVNIA